MTFLWLLWQWLYLGTYWWSYNRSRSFSQFTISWRLVLCVCTCQWEDTSWKTWMGRPQREGSSEKAPMGRLQKEGSNGKTLVGRFIVSVTQSLIVFLYTSKSVFMRMVVSWCPKPAHQNTWISLTHYNRHTPLSLLAYDMCELRSHCWYNVFIILALARLLKGDSHRELQQLLSNIMSITVAVVNLEYNEQVLPPSYQPVSVINSVCIVLLRVTLYNLYVL